VIKLLSTVVVLLPDADVNNQHKNKSGINKTDTEIVLHLMAF